MATGEALQASEVPARGRLALSLAGAVLISLAGFALILILVSELPRLLLTAEGRPTPMVAAMLPFLRTPIMRVLVPMMPMLMVFPAIVIAGRKRRSTNAGPRLKF